jgi:hypothetical protein
MAAVQQQEQHQREQQQPEEAPKGRRHGGRSSSTRCQARAATADAALLAKPEQADSSCGTEGDAAPTGATQPVDSQGAAASHISASAGTLSCEDEAAGGLTGAAGEAAVTAKQVERLQGQLTGLQEERYQLQLALRAAHKQLGLLQQAGSQRALSAAAVATAVAEEAADSRPGSSSSGGGRCQGHDSSSTAMQDKLCQLEGALRQASSDYGLILRELGAMRAEGLARQAGLQAALADKADAEAHADRLRDALAVLQQQLAAASTLQATHHSMAQRVSSAVAAATALPDQQPPQPPPLLMKATRSSRALVSPPSSLLGASEASLVGLLEAGGASPGGRAAGRPASVDAGTSTAAAAIDGAQQPEVAPRTYWGRSTVRGSRDRERCLPPSGFM